MCGAFPRASIAFVDGVDPPVPLVADGQPETAPSTETESLEEGQTFPCRAAQERLLPIGSVFLEDRLIPQELVPADVPWMMVLDGNLPRFPRHLNHPHAEVSGRRHLFLVAIAAKHVGAGIGRILEYAEDAPVSEAPGDDPAIPDAPV